MKAKTNLRAAVLPFAIAAGLGLVTVASADASTVYTYTGNNFTAVSGPVVFGQPFFPLHSTADHVTVSFILDAPLGINHVGGVVPISFTFSDGVQNINQDTPGLSFTSFNIMTDGTGNFTQWFLRACKSGSFTTCDYEILSFWEYSGADHEFIGVDWGRLSLGDQLGPGYVFSGYSSQYPGSWTVTPLPAALPLFLTGLAALGLLAGAGSGRRRRELLV